MWEELSKSVKAVLYDRISSPLVGTFAVSWVLWNHRFFMILFSGMEPIAKFETIDTVLYPTTSCVVWLTVVFPLITTIGFIFLYPYPARFVFEFTRKQQKRLKEIRQKIEDETPLTLEESREIRSSALQAQLQYEKDIQALAEENQQLRSEIQKLVTPKEKIEKRGVSSKKKESGATIVLGNELREDSIDALVKIAKNEGVAYTDFINDLVRNKKISTVKANHFLDTLLNGHYVDKDYAQRLFLKDKGRALLVERNLV